VIEKGNKLNNKLNKLRANKDPRFCPLTTTSKKLCFVH